MSNIHAIGAELDPLESSEILEPWEIADFRESSIFPIFPLLRSGLYHRTLPKSYMSIIRDGYINSNRGEYPFTYPQSEFYYGFSKGYVCLFDFESTTEENCALTHHTWAGFFINKPFTVALKIDREMLGEKLIPNNVPPRLSEPGYKGFIPFVEVWYPDPIPVSAILSGLIIVHNSKTGFVEYQEFSRQNLQENVEFLMAELDRYAKENNKNSDK